MQYGTDNRFEYEVLVGAAVLHILRGLFLLRISQLDEFPRALVAREANSIESRVLRVFCRHMHTSKNTPNTLNVNMHITSNKYDAN